MPQKYESRIKSFISANDFFFNYPINQIMSTFLHLSAKLPPWGKNILSNVTPKQTKCIPIFKYSVIILMGFSTKKFQFENQTQMYQNKWITMMLQALQIKILTFLDNQIIHMCINSTT
jgi:hypothetical protein